MSEGKIGTFITATSSALAGFVVSNYFITKKQIKLEKAKHNITDKLFEEIGYLKCRLDKLIEENQNNEKKTFAKIFHPRNQHNNNNLAIKEIEQQIKEKYQKVKDIRSSDYKKMFHYVNQNG